MKVLSYDEFVEINDQEFDCIFAESGADRELDFNRENEVEKFYFDKDKTNKSFPQIVFLQRKIISE